MNFAIIVEILILKSSLMGSSVIHIFFYYNFHYHQFTFFFQFMKFIKKLGEGAKIDNSKDAVEDLQVSNGLVPRSMSESWSAEFMKEQEQPHQQWGEEFTKQLGELQFFLLPFISTIKYNY